MSSTQHQPTAAAKPAGRRLSIFGFRLKNWSFRTISFGLGVLVMPTGLSILLFRATSQIVSSLYSRHPLADPAHSFDAHCFYVVIAFTWAVLELWMSGHFVFEQMRRNTRGKQHSTLQIKRVLHGLCSLCLTGTALSAMVFIVAPLFMGTKG